MLRVEPYYSNNTIVHAKNSKKEPEKNNKQKIIITTLAGAAVMGGIVYGIVRHGKNNAVNKTEEKVVNSIKEVFEEQMSKFPQDIDYRKLLLKGLKVDKADLYKLRPIAGPQEYKNIVKEFSENPIHYTAGDSLITDLKDVYPLNGVQSKTFRASMHMHTLHSDGKLSVQELLDKSAKYADEVFEAIQNNPQAKAKNAPFTVAITDHDTLEGCKEAVKIISANPEKYKNLRVVLGVEMTVENRMLRDNLTAPVPIHMTVLGVNPYSSELNQLFDEKKINRTKLMRKLIEECSKLTPKLAENFSFEEAEQMYPALRNKVTHINYSTRDYIQKKIIDSGQYDKNSEELKQVLQKVNDICMSELPQMELNPAFVDMEYAIDLIKKQPHGYMTWAHPACTGIGKYLKNNDSYKGMETIFKLFKEKGGERTLAAEIHYPYYGELGQSTDWLNAIKYYAKSNGLYFTGGMDSHGKNIFYSNK